MIGHIVLFTPKAELSAPQRRSFAQSVLDTCGAIPSVRRVCIGRRIDVDPGYGRNLGDKTYDFAAVLEFDGREDLVAYLTDPRHHALGRLFWEYCEASVVSEVEYIDARAPDAADKLAL